MLNSTDLKDDNNSIYELKEPWDGAARWFVVRDLGAALGETGKLFPRRNWLEGFEKHGFITSVGDGTIEFDYKGRHQELLVDDRARLTSRGPPSSMQRLTDAAVARCVPRRQLRRARSPSATSGASRQKIADGLALRATVRVRRSDADVRTSDAAARVHPLRPATFSKSHAAMVARAMLALPVAARARRGAGVPSAPPRHAAALGAGHPDADRPRRRRRLVMLSSARAWRARSASSAPPT